MENHKKISDIMETIENFYAEKINIDQFLNKSLDQVHDLPEDTALDVGAFEDAWGEIEIIYALAVEAGQTALDAKQTAEVEKAVQEMERLIAKAL